MSNIIQIKRSTSSATPETLANGEFAYTSLVDVLYIGSPNGSVVAIGGARTPGILTANQALVANSSGSIDEIRTANLVPTKIYANGSFGSGGNILASNGSGIYWTNAVVQAVTSVDSGSGLTGGPITNTGTLSVLANSGIIANSSGLFVRAGTGITVNSTGVHIGQDVGTTAAVSFGSISISGNAALGDSSSDVVSLNGTVNTSIMPTANTTYNIGNNTMRWAEIHAANVHSNTGYFDGSVQISGNLSVLGTTFTVSSNNLIVDDSMIQLAANNTTSDLLDIGFFGSYNPDNGAHEHAGLFRDATDDTFKLFKGLQESPTNTVNTGGTGYTMATLQSYLVSGALTTNSTNLSITANSTVSVALVANTLSLTTALLGTSGGTGRSTSTNNALLVGNSTNGYNVLNLGTSGYVLQSNGTALVYDVLDGGTF